MSEQGVSFPLLFVVGLFDDKAGSACPTPRILISVKCVKKSFVVSWTRKNWGCKIIHLGRFFTYQIIIDKSMKLDSRGCLVIWQSYAIP